MINQTILSMDDNADLLQLARLIFNKMCAKAVAPHDDLWGTKQILYIPSQFNHPGCKNLGPPRDLEICNPRLLMSQLRLTMMIH